MTSLYNTPAHIARARQAVAGTAKVMWADTDRVNRQQPAEDSPFLKRYETAILKPIRGALPFFTAADVEAAYGPNQQTIAQIWADTFAGLYWLTCRRRIEFELPADVYVDDQSPNWDALRRAYVERLHWFKVLGGSGMTTPTAMRFTQRVRDRGGHRGVEDLALAARREWGEPGFERVGGIRLARIGDVRVSGHTPPPRIDYEVGGTIVPQIGRVPLEREKPFERI